MQRTTYQRDAVVSPATLQQAVLAQSTKGMEEYSQVLFNKEGKFNDQALPAFNEAQTKAIKEYMDTAVSKEVGMQTRENASVGFELAGNGGKITGEAWQKMEENDKINAIRGAVDIRNQQWVERHEKGEIDQNTLKAGLYQEGSLMMNEARGKAMENQPHENGLGFYADSTVKGGKSVVNSFEKVKEKTNGGVPTGGEGWKERLD